MRKFYKSTLKLATCLILFGGIYFLIVGNNDSKDRSTDMSKLGAVRSSLNESLIASGELSTFNESDAAAGSVLDRLVSSLKSTLTDTEKVHKEATLLLESSQNDEINEVIASQRQAIKQHEAMSTNLSQMIVYDPEADLGKLDLIKDKQALKERSLAASKGLQAAISKQTEFTSDGLSVGNAGEADILRLDELTLAQAKRSSECFSRLASAVDGPNAPSIRSECIRSYSVMRGQLLKSLLSTSFSDTYIKNLQSQMLPLLKSIDSKISSQSPS